MDLTVSITGATVGAAMLTVGGYFAKEKLAEIKARRQAFESHIKLCGEKAVEFALLEQRVVNIEKQIELDRKARHWIIDCFIKIGRKMELDLPERPE